jgi:endo-1,4-beta-mannosidase
MDSNLRESAVRISHMSSSVSSSRPSTFYRDSSTSAEEGSFGVSSFNVAANISSFSANIELNESPNLYLL